MYPYRVLFDLGMYEILLVVGFVLALIYFRLLADRADFGASLQNICILGGLVGLIGGYGMAIVTQAIYNALASGRFEIASDTGATFYGGLVGGIGFYVLFYFLAGRFFLNRGEAKANFGRMSDIAAGAIALAHACGRLGCLFAGCCHGAVTDAWYGIYHVRLQAKIIPVQLFEAIFLLALCAFLTWRFFKGKGKNLAVYLVLYAIWRFFVEYLRDDDRGSTIVSFLSPSQLTSVLLCLVGSAILLSPYIVKKWRDRHEA